MRSLECLVRHELPQPEPGHGRRGERGTEPVMAIGGFNGTDSAPALAEFERLVAAGEIHYFVGANQASFGGGSGPAAQITTWVRAHYTAKTVGGVTVYDLARPR